jgi:hypothetical protein
MVWEISINVLEEPAAFIFRVEDQVPPKRWLLNSILYSIMSQRNLVLIDINIKIRN